MITRFCQLGVASIALIVGTPVAFATPQLDMWDAGGWTRFASDDGMAEGPGGGGQDFDAEYMFYMYDGTVLSLGLQTGFDIEDNEVIYGGVGGKSYYGGDLFLSFDGDASTDGSNVTSWEYVVDFGLYTEDFVAGHKVDADVNGVDDNAGDGLDGEGVYEVSAWNTHIIAGHEVSNPFAMDGGTMQSGLLSNAAGYDDTHDTYYRTVSFTLSDLELGYGFHHLDAHWTMSCGNDNMNGSLPEPPVLTLLSLGLIGLIFRRVRRGRQTRPRF